MLQFFFIPASAAAGKLYENCTKIVGKCTIFLQQQMREYKKNAARQHSSLIDVQFFNDANLLLCDHTISLMQQQQLQTK